MTKENAIKYGEIISKCWEDEVYREEFIRDPESVMLEKGIELEEGITYKVIQAPKLVEYFVLPYDNVMEPSFPWMVTLPRSIFSLFRPIW